MALLVLSFLAGVLTVAAPCILPLLPIIVGGSIVDSNKKSFIRPLVIAASLVVSIVLSTLLLKASTALLGVPTVVWQILAGGLVVLLGLNFLWPEAYEKLAAGLFARSNKALATASKRQGLFGALLIGVALGPVFSSCSPTYALIVAAILPTSFLQGLVYLASYAIGLALVLLLVAYAGQALVAKLAWLSKPHGLFRRVVGVVFIVIGLSVSLGVDKTIQAFVIQQGWYEPIRSIEQQLTR